MKRHTLLIAFSLVLILAGSALAATSKQTGNTAGVLKMSGTIVSSSSSELVLSCQAKGNMEQEKFVVNPQTKTKGTLTSGEKAIVRYRNENGQKVATMISAQAMMTAKSK